MDANIAYYCLHKIHLLPSEYISLPKKEKAFIIAAVQVKLEKDKKEAAKMRKSRK